MEEPTELATMEKNRDALSDPRLWSHWIRKEPIWNRARHITMGIDAGSTYTKGVVMFDGELDASLGLSIGSLNPDCSQIIFSSLTHLLNIPPEKINVVIGTGYGRVHAPMAMRTVTEVSCHTRGAIFLYGAQVRTIVDVGGQDIKAIRCNEKGKVTNFILNDKCAAGTGRGLEALAERLDIPLHKFGLKFLSEEDAEAPLSNSCMFFLKDECIRLLREGWRTEQIEDAVCRFTAEHIQAVVKRAGVEAHLVVTGGLAKNTGVMQRLSVLLGRPFPHPQGDPQFAGAIGAAIYGQVLCQKGKTGKR